MSPPLPSVFVQGQGSVSADNLNTFIQNCQNVAQARTFPGVAGMQMYLMGFVSPGDGGAGVFWWNANAINPSDDNGLTTIVPSGVAQGCWSRQIGGVQWLFGATPNVVGASATTYIGPAGNQTQVNAAVWIMPGPGSIVAMFGSGTVGPGTGQTVTFTIYKDSVAVGSPGILSGSGGTGAFQTGLITQSIPFILTDQLQVQIVTSSGAASAQFSVVLVIT